MPHSLARTTGFTLVELLATLALTALFLGMALPAMNGLIDSNRSSTTLNEFRTALALARNHAVSQRTRVVVCKRSDTLACTTQGNWNDGWLVFVSPTGQNDCTDANTDGFCDVGGGRILRVGDGIHASLQLAGSGNLRHRLPYNSLGMSPGYMGRFRVCDREGGGSLRELVVYATGRVRVANRDELGSCGK